MVPPTSCIHGEDVDNTWAPLPSPTPMYALHQHTCRPKPTKASLLVPFNLDIWFLSAWTTGETKFGQPAKPSHLHETSSQPWAEAWSFNSTNSQFALTTKGNDQARQMFDNLTSLVSPLYFAGALWPHPRHGTGMQLRHRHRMHCESPSVTTLSQSQPKRRWVAKISWLAPRVRKDSQLQWAVGTSIWPSGV